MFKFFALFALVAVVNCGGYESAVRVTPEEPIHHTIEEYDSHPQYTFTYGVHDSISGDSKTQTETRNGDIVNGEYSLLDADGYKRTVTYTADGVNGFNAVVDRQPAATPVVVKAAPVVVKTPVVVKSVTPVTYSAPLIKSVPIAYSTPTYIRQLPIAYSTPSFVRSVYQPLAYTAGSSLFRTVPLAYNTAGWSGSGQLAYTVPSPYIAKAEVKTAPIATSQW